MATLELGKRCKSYSKAMTWRLAIEETYNSSAWCRCNDRRSRCSRCHRWIDLDRLCAGLCLPGLNAAADG